MIKIRGAFLSRVIDKLPLPDVMRKEIKTIPQVHCEYQQVDCENSKCDNLQPTNYYNSEMDPLTRSNALIAESNNSIDSRHDMDNQLQPGVEHSQNCLSDEDSRIEISAKVISQSPTAASIKDQVEEINVC